MANGLNKVFLLGNLGADPEMKMTQGGQAVMSLRLATSRTYLDRNKVKQEDVQWHTVIIWGKRAEGLAKFLEKGMRLHIEGELRHRQWEKDDGTKGYATEVRAFEITLCEKAPNSGNRPPPADEPDYGRGGGDDDIPF